MVLIGMVMIEVSKPRDSPAFKIGLDYPSNQDIFFNTEAMLDIPWKDQYQVKSFANSLEELGESGDNKYFNVKYVN